MKAYEVRAQAIHKAIGAEVRKIRKKSEIGQTMLAPKLGLDQSALSRIENGLQMLTVAQWVLLCRHTATKDRLAEKIQKRLTRAS